MSLGEARASCMHPRFVSGRSCLRSFTCGCAQCVHGCVKSSLYSRAPASYSHFFIGFGEPDTLCNATSDFCLLDEVEEPSVTCRRKPDMRLVVIDGLREH